MKKIIAAFVSFFVAPFLASPVFSSLAFAEPAKAARAAGPAKAGLATVVTSVSGLRYIDSSVGLGDTAVTGKSVAVHYTGWILEAGDKKGTKFDSSLDRGQPFTFRLGQGMVIQGWDEGVAGMKVGGKRTLLIPAKLGYGAQGVGPIPGNADLTFDVELITVK